MWDVKVDTGGLKENKACTNKKNCDMEDMEEKICKNILRIFR